jgi:hypothetical protein
MYLKISMERNVYCRLANNNKYHGCRIPLHSKKTASENMRTLDPDPGISVAYSAIIFEK